MTTPLMGLEEVNAGVGGDSPSTAWNKVITNFQDLDAHDHTTGNGAKITTGALNIDANLPMNNHSISEVVSAIFTNQPAPLTTSYGLYVENGDLVYRSSSQKVPITANGNSLAVVGSPGSISGMLAPQTVSYALGFYRFYQDVGLLATLQSAGIAIGSETTPNATNFVTLKADPTTGYNLTFPAADPDTNKVLWSSNGSGDLIWVDGLKKSGTVAANQIMLATSATDMTGLTVANNQIILGTASTPVSGQIVDSYVAAAAAIAGTKITPAFGAQNISTTGTLSTGAATVASVSSSGPISGTTLTASGNSVSFTNSLGAFTVAPPTTFNNNVTISGSNALTVGGSATITGLAIFNNNIASNVNPDGNGTRLLGSVSNRWVGNFTTINASSTSTFGGQVVFNSTINSSTTPSANNTFDLGSSGNRWRDLWISGTVSAPTLSATTGNITTVNAFTVNAGGNMNANAFVASANIDTPMVWSRSTLNTTFGQGSLIGWNTPGGTGKTVFWNNRGGGGGGFSWYNSNAADGNPSNLAGYTSLADLNNNGDLNIRQDFYGRDARLTNNLYINTGNTSGYGIILSDDGDIVDLNDSYCAMRFSGGVRVHSGNRTGGPVITLAANGQITAKSIYLDDGGVAFKVREIRGTQNANTLVTVANESLILGATIYVRRSGFSADNWVTLAEAEAVWLNSSAYLQISNTGGNLNLNLSTISGASSLDYRIMAFYL